MSRCAGYIQIFNAAFSCPYQGRSFPNDLRRQDYFCYLFGSLVIESTKDVISLARDCYTNISGDCIPPSIADNQK
jgi:hypothetical protein